MVFGLAISFLGKVTVSDAVVAGPFAFHPLELPVSLDRQRPARSVCRCRSFSVSRTSTAGAQGRASYRLVEEAVDGVLEQVSAGGEIDFGEWVIFGDGHAWFILALQSSNMSCLA
jgi:hypothetical protein